MTSVKSKQIGCLYAGENACIIPLSVFNKVPLSTFVQISFLLSRSYFLYLIYFLWYFLSLLYRISSIRQ